MPPRPARAESGAVLVLCLLLAGCTEAGLRTAKALDQKISLEGELCTGQPVATLRNIRVLFLTDSSNSMRFNDPNDLLVDALEHLTGRHAGNPHIAFAVIRWGSRRVVRENVDYAPVGTDPPLFTNDPALLAEIWARMRADPTINPDKYLDGTDYEMALRAATDYIVADIAKNPVQSLTNRYLIQFVTDGIPQSATNDPLETRRNILASTANLHQRYGARVDVTSIALSMVIPPEFIGLLPEMARVGGGEYTQLATPDGLDGAFEGAVANPRQLVEYELASYFVFNRNLRVGVVEGEYGLWLDSDGDGLVDAFEERLGTSPTHPDTDADGLSDLFEHRLKGQYDPLAFDRSDRGADGDLDPDGDGLTNFEESRLSTDPLSADTDRDGIPDDVELHVGLEPIDDDGKSDVDGDLVTAFEEVQQNLSPAWPEEAGERAKLAYRTRPAGAPFRYADGVRCYQFRVDNVQLGPTLAGVDARGRQRPAGLNSLEVIAIERPLLDSSATSAFAGLLPYRQLRAERFVLTGPSGTRDPRALTLRLEAREFGP